MAPALRLRDGDAEELDQLLRSTSTPAGLVRRAQIVALAAEGMAKSRIGEVVGTSVPTVLKWRSRHLDDGLLDAERSGRPRHVNHADVVAATLMPPTKKYGRRRTRSCCVWSRRARSRPWTLPRRCTTSPTRRHSQRVARRPPEHPRPRHPDVGVPAQPRRGVVRNHRPPSNPARRLKHQSRTSMRGSEPSLLARMTSHTPSYGRKQSTKS